jgi:long-subunit acyl-CoA synthetase (AMP-forming)
MSEVTVAVTLGLTVAGMCNGRVKKAVPAGSVGVLLPGMQARIMIEVEGKDGLRDANPSETGELWLRGHSVALGYYNDEKATKAAFGVCSGKDDKGGWLRTGDRFRIDSDGFFL